MYNVNETGEIFATEPAHLTARSAEVLLTSKAWGSPITLSCLPKVQGFGQKR